MGYRDRDVLGLDGCECVGIDLFTGSLLTEYSNIWAPEEQKDMIKVRPQSTPKYPDVTNHQDHNEPLRRLRTTARNDVHRARNSHFETSPRTSP